MRQACTSIEMAFETYSRDVARVAEDSQPWNPGACRRR
jgi:hypothetical protein